MCGKKIKPQQHMCHILLMIVTLIDIVAVLLIIFPQSEAGTDAIVHEIWSYSM